MGNSIQEEEEWKRQGPEQGDEATGAGQRNRLVRNRTEAEQDGKNT